MEIMSSSRASARHDSASSGRSSQKGPTHSTPLKSESLKSYTPTSTRSTPMSTPTQNRLYHSDFLMDSYCSDSNLSDLELSYRTSSDHHNKSSPFVRNSSTTHKPITSPFSSVKKDLSSSLRSCDIKTKPRSSHYRGGVAGVGNMSASESIGDFVDISSSQQAKLADFENQTIQKQRQELALLVAELRDRDRELNDMVSTHQKQLSAWDQDRQKILRLEEKCLKSERDIQNKNDEIRGLTAKVHVIQCEDSDKSAALNNTQEQLVMMSEQHSQASLHLQDIEYKNRSLQVSVRDMSCAVGQLEAREQELLTVLQLKDRDLSEASTHIAELGARLKKMELQHKDAKTLESDGRRHIMDLKNKCSDQQREIDYTKKLLQRSEQRGDEQHIEIQRLRQDASTLKKEVTLASEREKRKDQLLDLQKSKQDRADTELNNVRTLYERQQKDLSLLHVNLENTKDLLHKNNIHVPGMGTIGLAPTKPPHRSSYNTSTRLTGSSSYRSYTPGRRSDWQTDSSRYKSHSGHQLGNYEYQYASTRDNDKDISEIYDDDDESDPKDEHPIGSSSANENGGLEDDDLDIQRAETPPQDNRADPNVLNHVVRETNVRETDSPATKLHKLLTESRDMVEELEKSATDKEISASTLLGDNKTQEDENQPENEEYQSDRVDALLTNDNSDVST